ncbi:MAG: prolyl oligopeptidase family serine peptidase [Verrucomicrobiia bacterium]
MKSDRLKLKGLISVVIASLFIVSCARVRYSINYPHSPPTNQVDYYHGVAVSDPYRWLEDLNSPQVKKWIEEQNRVTFDFLEKIPQREAIKRRLTELWNYERFGVPFKKGGRYFYSRNDGLQNQNVIYTVDRLDGTPRVLIDPNLFSKDGRVALSGLVITEDGKFAAYGIAAAGSDWQEWRVRNVETGEDLPDKIEWVKFSSAAWTADGKGFYYSRFDKPADASKLTQVNYFHKLYYHRLGTSQEEDVLVYHRPDQKEWNFYPETTSDGRFLIISVSQGTSPKRRIFYLNLKEPNAKVTPLLTDFDAAYDFIDNDGDLFWFRTDLNAPRGRIIAIDIKRPQRENWREIIPESKETMSGVSVVGNRFIVTYLKDAHSQVKIYTLEGRFEYELELPRMGSVSGFYGKREDMETFFMFTDFTTPGTIYRFELDSKRISVFKKPQVKFNPEDYQTRQVFYESKDGTVVPMFITYKKGIKLNGKNPTLLYGYGGFNISITPSFSVPNLVWLEMGGIYAVANIRGGGEYGEEWHQAGTKLKKQNVFDDFIAAAEYLIKNRYTQPRKLAIAGGSNGGLLVGAVLNQRPDLFGAALPAVGVMDMLRFHKFTIGWAWVSDYGSPDNPEEFKALYAYSPYHNIKPGAKYPATLITTADHDDRVVPSHSFKYAAALQNAQGGAAPILIRIETRAGHGAGKPTALLIEESADKLSFIVHSLKMKPRLEVSK